MTNQDAPPLTAQPAGDVQFCIRMGSDDVPIVSSRSLKIHFTSGRFGLLADALFRGSSLLVKKQYFHTHFRLRFQVRKETNNKLDKSKNR